MPRRYSPRKNIIFPKDGIPLDVADNVPDDGTIIDPMAARSRYT